MQISECSDAGGSTVLRTLVDELVEGMLSIGPWLPPHNGSGVIVHTGAIFSDVLPVRLHVALATTRMSVSQSFVSKPMV